MKKVDAVDLLANEGWTKKDAERALAAVDFTQEPDELTIWKAALQFSGPELLNRQRLQAAQKAQVTKKEKKIEEKAKENSSLRARIEVLTAKNEELLAANDRLKKDNKDLKNIVDRIKLQLAIDIRKIMRLEDSEIRQALAKWFSSTQG